MSSSRSFFNACLGLTIVLPLFFIDLAALDFFGRSSATVAANPNAPDIVRMVLARNAAHGHWAAHCMSTIALTRNFLPSILPFLHLPLNTTASQPTVHKHASTGKSDDSGQWPAFAFGLGGWNL